MDKNKRLKPLNRKKDFDLLKKSARAFSFRWLKIFFLYKKEGSLQVAWSLSKRNISSSVLRNRLKRWGRENMRRSHLMGLALVVFLRRDRDFFKNLRREDFDFVFNSVLEKIDRKN